MYLVFKKYALESTKPSGAGGSHIDNILDTQSGV
jgi:hypothetical protein